MMRMEEEKDKGVRKTRRKREKACHTIQKQILFLSMRVSMTFNQGGMLKDVIERSQE